MAEPTEIFMPGAVPAGYGAIVDRHRLSVVRPARWTFLAKHGGERVEPDRIALRLPRDAGRMTDVDHLLFALRYEGVYLPVLDAYLERIGRETLEAAVTGAVRATPTSKYVRVLWFLTEWLTGRLLPVPDLRMGNYVSVLDEARYITAAPRRARRQRVLDNLLGDRAFCPFVRRTEELSARSPAALTDAMSRVIAVYDPAVVARALSYLYTKETLSSFAMERETPGPDRAEKFGQLLRRTGEVRALDEASLVALQNAIVDPRFVEPGFRSVQNYVGESLSLTRQRVHFVPPRPDAIHELMAAWGEMAAALTSPVSTTDPVVAAACVSFGFVFLHPFRDGNGRLHRFLVHHVLARRGVTPPNFIVPVSAVMLAQRQEYDAALESFSAPLIGAVDHTIDEEGEVKVPEDTRRHYRYIDLTTPAAALYRWLDAAVGEELPGELEFLLGVDRAKLAMSHVVDLPDRLADLFIKVVLQNGGRLSRTKRNSHFDRLSDDEIERLEAVVVEHTPKRSFT